MPKTGKYIIRKPNTSFWYVSLRLPKDAPPHILALYGGRRDLVKSLGTRDEAEAEILALNYIKQHKALLLLMRNKPRQVRQRKWKPGAIYFDNGERFFATETELHFMDGDRIYRVEINPIEDTVVFDKLDRDDLPTIDSFVPEAHIPEDVRPRVNPDDRLIEAYARTLDSRLAKDCRDMWSLYKEVVKKPLKVATRDDGILLADALRERNPKMIPKTVDKRVGWLRAAVNMAIRDRKLDFNPFSHIVSAKEIKRGSTRKRRFSEDEMAIARASFDKMTVRAKELKLLWILLASTGMRLGEAHQICEEFEEDQSGIRYVIIGTKTEESMRRVPLPNCVLPYLPKRISAPLFSASAKRNSIDLNRWLAKCGIHSKEKTVHCLRHRAQDRLRATGCPVDKRWELLGHEKRTIAESYGEGSPLSQLKPFLDKVGF